MFFTTIAIVIPAIQLLTQNMNKELQKCVWNTVEHLHGTFWQKNV